MSYLPKRLIDINLLQNMVSQNPFTKEPAARLLAYDVPKIVKPPSELLKVDKQIQKIKNSGFEEIGPSLLNGLLFIIICLIIYSVLYYKYYKKKESQK
jgi:hypothetical protein